MQLTLDEISLSSIDAMGGIEALCAFVGEDERPLNGLAGYADWRMCGMFSRILQANLFQGARNDCLLYPVGFGLRVEKAIFFGTGSLEHPDAETMHALLQKATDVLNNAAIRSFVIELPGLTEDTAKDMLAAFVDTCLRHFKGEEIVLMGSDVMILSRALQSCGDAIRELDICLDDRSHAISRKKKLASRPQSPSSSISMV